MLFYSNENNTIISVFHRLLTFHTGLHARAVSGTSAFKRGDTAAGSPETE